MKIFTTNDLYVPLDGDRVLIRNAYHLENPIRFRVREIADREPYISTVRSFLRIAEIWQKQPATILCRGEISSLTVIPEHDTQMVCECPMSPAILVKQTVATRDAVVIYLPPRWDQHWEHVLARFPEIEQRRAWFATLPRDGSEVPYLREQRHLIRTTIAVRRRMAIYRTYLRAAPTLNARAEAMWDKLSAVAINGRATIAKPGRFDRLLMHKLVRMGCISAPEITMTYDLEGYEPKWKLQGIHRQSKIRGLEKIIALAEAAPDYQTR